MNYWQRTNKQRIIDMNYWQRTNNCIISCWIGCSRQRDPSLPHTLAIWILYPAIYIPYSTSNYRMPSHNPLLDWLQPRRGTCPCLIPWSSEFYIQPCISHLAHRIIGCALRIPCWIGCSPQREPSLPHTLIIWILYIAMYISYSPWIYRVSSH